LKCLIIAAGKGSRLSPEGGSKPLFPLLGASIIERVILTAKSCGIKDFYVVTGYKGEKVRLFLDGLKRSKNINITHIINDEWERGNGISVLKARDKFKEPFLLLMGDHLFDKEIIIKLKNLEVKNDEVILAVDFKTDSNNLVDIDDVTKVCVRNNRVVNIGKKLTDYNAYDTGIFLCSPAIFYALEKSITEYNDESLSGGTNVLAQDGKVKIFDVGDSFWIDIDDKKAFKRAEKYLISTLRKPSDGPISKYINRPLSIRLTKHLVKTSITPNQISLFSFFLSVMAATFFFFTNYIPLMIGGILAQVSSIIDGCDGEVARLKYRESNFGGWFDAVLDRYADAFMLFGLTYNTFVRSGNILFLVIGFFAIIGSFMNSYTADKYDSLMKRKLGYSGGFRIGRDIRIFLIFIGAIIYQPFFILLILALLMNAENIRRVMICYRFR
jgi:CDP-L-myo-inositol myo-inositolphosphotransferase